MVSNLCWPLAKDKALRVEAPESGAFGKNRQLATLLIAWKMAKPWDQDLIKMTHRAANGSRHAKQGPQQVNLLSDSIRIRSSGRLPCMAGRVGASNVGHGSGVHEARLSQIFRRTRRGAARAVRQSVAQGASTSYGREPVLSCRHLGVGWFCGGFGWFWAVWSWQRLDRQIGAQSSDRPDQQPRSRKLRPCCELFGMYGSRSMSLKDLSPSCQEDGFTARKYHSKPVAS